MNNKNLKQPHLLGDEEKEKKGDKNELNGPP
jgi:hypothetical protein